MRTWPVRAILQSRRARNTSVTFSCNPCKTARDDGYKSRVCTPQSSESHHPKEVICHSPKTPERSSSVDEPASAGEVAQLRRELAHGLGVVTHNLQVVQDTIKPELAYTLATGGRKKNNLKVGKANFSVPIGPAAEELEDFDAKWVALLKADGCYSKFVDCFARTVLKAINQYARDLLNSDHEIVLAACVCAAELGKGALRASRPPPEPARPPRAA